MAVHVLLITGPVGVGKTTAALEASRLLQRVAIPHAVIDLDALCWCYPAPSDDYYRTRLALQNLSVVWANYAAAGARRLILVRVVESQTDVERLQGAIPGAEMTTLRLRASSETLKGRIIRREEGLGRPSVLARALELARLMDTQSVEDCLVDTDGLRPTEVANRVLECVTWT